MQDIDWSTSARTVGWKNVPTPPGLPPVVTRAPAATASSTWRCTISRCAAVAVVLALTQLAHLVGELGDELVIDWCLDVDAFHRDAHLTGIEHPAECDPV